jgi:hypothetical protein
MASTAQVNAARLLDYVVGCVSYLHTGRGEGNMDNREFKAEVGAFMIYRRGDDPLDKPFEVLQYVGTHWTSHGRFAEVKDAQRVIDQIKVATPKEKR